MSEVYFYHLTRTSLDVTLAELLGKTRAKGWKAVVRGAAAARMSWLDERLWIMDEGSFLPHGLAGGPHDELQPILLCNQEIPENTAELLFLMDGAEISPDQVQAHQRVCIVFDGNDDKALNTARGQWKSLSEAKIPAKYWSQESGNWQEKAAANQSE